MSNFSIFLDSSCPLRVGPVPYLQKPLSGLEPCQGHILDVLQNTLRLHHGLWPECKEGCLYIWCGMDTEISWISVWEKCDRCWTSFMKMQTNAYHKRAPQRKCAENALGKRITKKKKKTILKKISLFAIFKRKRFL